LENLQTDVTTFDLDKFIGLEEDIVEEPDEEVRSIREERKSIENIQEIIQEQEKSVDADNSEEDSVDEDSSEEDSVDEDRSEEESSDSEPICDRELRPRTEKVKPLKYTGLIQMKQPKQRAMTSEDCMFLYGPYPGYRVQ
jgi:hypothetical protein